MKRALFTILRLFAISASMVALSIGAQAGTCYIDGNSRIQTIDGFGFSSAWSGQLSSAKNNALYNILGMSLLRIRIDPNSYWGDETANASAAHAYGVKVMGTPWSPPASMKDNNNVVHGSLRTDQYSNYASYLNQAANSIGLDYVSIQNEPDWNPDYESCVWTPSQIFNFCKYYAQNINKPVIMPESLSFNDDYSDPTLNDATAASHITVAAGHFYGNGNYVHQNAINKGKRVWMTEHYIDNAQANMGNCITIAKEISDAMYNQFNAYFWWWVPDYDTNANLVYSDGTIYKNGYTIGQFAKWVRPGKQRISSTYNPTSGVYVTAYTNDGSVIVAVNTSNSAVNQQFTLSNLNASQFTAYRTSSSENMNNVGTLNVSGGSFSSQLPAQSITTFVQSGTIPTSGVVFYQDYNYSGTASQALGAGSYTISQLADRGMPNDWASSVRVPSGYTVTMYENGDFTGSYWTLTADTSEFGSIGANDQVSSVVVELNITGTKKIVARHSGKAIDAYGAHTDNGTQLIQWNYGGGTNQQWTVTDLGDGEYSIIGVQSGKSIDISNWGTDNGSKVQLWDYFGGTNQKFYITPTDGGYYRITPTHAPNSCLDVEEISTADGAKVHLWTWLGGQNQQWAFQAP